MPQHLLPALAILAGLAVSVAPVQAAPDDGDTIVDAALGRIPPVETYRLKNGLQVVVQSLPTQSQVGVVLTYRIGSRDELRDQKGLAHLVEHMTYRGSLHLAPYEAIALTEAQGGTHTGGTGFDDTTYAHIVPKGAFTRALWIESERMAFTLGRFTQHSLDHERRSIASERHLLLSNPQSLFEAAISVSLFGEDSPYAHPVDDARYVTALDLDAVRTFFHAGYRPENATLVVAGGVEARYARDRIEEYFGPIRNPKTRFVRATPPPVVPKPAHRIRMKTRYPAQLFEARWIMPVPSPREEVALGLMARLLQRKLWATLVARNEVAAISVDVRPLAPCWVFAIHAELNYDQSPEEVEPRLRSEIDGVWSSDIDAELKGIQDEEILSDVQALEKPMQLAMVNSMSMSLTGRSFDVLQHVSFVRSTTSADLRALQARFMHPMFAWLEHGTSSRF